MLISFRPVFNGEGSAQSQYDAFSNGELESLPSRECPICRHRNCLRIHGYYVRLVEVRGDVSRLRVMRLVIKYSALAGLPQIRVHGFRHSCVSWLLSNGMSYRTVARWVGDTEKVILQTYSHLIPDEKDQIAQFIGSLSGNPDD